MRSEIPAHRRRRAWFLASFLFATGLGACSSTSTATPSTAAGASGSTSAATSGVPLTRPPTGRAGTVTRVVDGDTIVVKVDGAEEKVRLIGIDTPETVDPRKPVQCFGREASDRAKALLPVGTAVTLVNDVEPRDKYGRTLAYVYRSPDNAFINLDLVRDGYARVYTFPPNVAHVDAFRAAERDARQARRGLWNAC